MADVHGLLCSFPVHGRCTSAAVAAALPSQRGGVVGGKQPDAPPQPPFPPGAVGAVQHLDDVADAEAQLVVLLRREVVQRPHLECGRPLWGKKKRERIKTRQLGDAA